MGWASFGLRGGQHGFCISGSKKMPKLPLVRELQPGFLTGGLGAETAGQDFARSPDGGLPRLPVHVRLPWRPSRAQTSLKQGTKAAHTFLLSSGRERAGLGQRDLETTEIFLTLCSPPPRHPRPLGRGRVWKQQACDEPGGWFLLPLRLSLGWRGPADEFGEPFPSAWEQGSARASWGSGVGVTRLREASHRSW